ncbi:hypothetical protein R3P38DRAFT_3172618 [Favolaschia claudopus]|uniref:Uncharacterized protein n=1 Tax=Favolaschia claudopus TaxID=2862362 RepID=A0AAW0DHS9_9AGAR
MRSKVYASWWNRDITNATPPLQALLTLVMLGISALAWIQATSKFDPRRFAIPRHPETHDATQPRERETSTFGERLCSGPSAFEVEPAVS